MHPPGSSEALPDADYLPARTLEQRIALGEELRRDVPHELHASWLPAAERDDPIAILSEQQSAERIPSWSRSATAGWRCRPSRSIAVALRSWRATSLPPPASGLRTQLCGDAHLLNFGLFQTPERTLVFGLNDFDETLPGPFEWDVKRLAASFEIAGGQLAWGRSAREKAVLATVRAYREAMIEFAEGVEIWRSGTRDCLQRSSRRGSLPSRIPRPHGRSSVSSTRRCITTTCGRSNDSSRTSTGRSASSARRR